MVLKQGHFYSKLVTKMRALFKPYLTYISNVIHFIYNYKTLVDIQLAYYLILKGSMRRNQLPVSAARWQHGFQISFATFCKKSQIRYKLNNN